ncbi:hypothetical protein NKF06_19960 [Haloferax sp. AB510]|nr:hypothetical protein [Haloferax sp. AB510]
MLHGVTIGDEVTVGHNVVVDYATDGDHVLVGMQSAVLRGVTVKSNSIIVARESSSRARRFQRPPHLRCTSEDQVSY